MQGQIRSNEVKVYEVIYAIGEKVYKEKSFVIPVESDFYFGEIEASGCVENFLCALGLFCASSLFIGAFISGLVIGSSELTAITGIGGTISYIESKHLPTTGDEISFFCSQALYIQHPAIIHATAATINIRKSLCKAATAKLIPMVKKAAPTVLYTIALVGLFFYLQVRCILRH